MQGILKTAKLPPVRIKLHWPDRWCPKCGQETEYVPLELYHCPSCHTISLGRTEYVGGEVKWINSWRTHWVDCTLQTSVTIL